MHKRKISFSGSIQQDVSPDSHKISIFTPEIVSKGLLAIRKCNDFSLILSCEHFLALKEYIFIFIAPIKWEKDSVWKRRKNKPLHFVSPVKLTAVWQPYNSREDRRVQGGLGLPNSGTMKTGVFSANT